jgi:hypothetical protein
LQFRPYDIVLEKRIDRDNCFDCLSSFTSCRIIFFLSPIVLFPNFPNQSPRWSMGTALPLRYYVVLRELMEEEVMSTNPWPPIYLQYIFRLVCSCSSNSIHSPSPFRTVIPLLDDTSQGRHRRPLLLGSSATTAHPMCSTQCPQGKNHYFGSFQFIDYVDMHLNLFMK